MCSTLYKFYFKEIKFAPSGHCEGFMKRKRNKTCGNLLNTKPEVCV